MKAVICPVCCGTGTIKDYGNPNTTTVITEKTCHGCGGCGWVCVPGDYNHYPNPWEDKPVWKSNTYI